MSDLVGKIIAGRYRVDQFLGRGGMAEVYKVWDQERAAVLAMKVLHEDLADDKVFLRRFRREAQTLSKLKHPNIVRFYELIKDGDLVFMLMEYVDGITLSKARGRIGESFSPAQVLGIMQSVCSALHFAHSIGLVHCDIKPANIMIDQTGRVLLTDFGIARMSEGAATATMVGAGTPAYMSPEQVAGADPTPQTDIYSLGVVLYYLVTGGERPFTGEKATITGTMGEKLRWEQRNLQPPPPSTYNPEISPELEAVILRCLSKEPKKRFISVNKLLDALTTAIQVQPESLPSKVLIRDKKTADDTISSAMALPARPSRSRTTYWIAGGVVVVLGILASVLVGGVLVFGGIEAMRPTTKPPQNSASPTPIVVTKVQVQVVEITATSVPPTPVRSTATPAPPPVSKLTVAKERDSKGYWLVIKGGPEDYDMRLGPIADGEFVKSNNGKFAAYVDDLGNVYIAQYDKANLQFIKKLNKKDFQALINGEKPEYRLSLSTDDNGTYWLRIDEQMYGQDATLQISRALTQ